MVIASAALTSVFHSASILVSLSPTNLTRLLLLLAVNVIQELNMTATKSSCERKALPDDSDNIKDYIGYEGVSKMFVKYTCSI